MKYAILATALSIYAAPALADQCNDDVMQYAVMFKLEEVFGSDFPFAGDLSQSRLGSDHWKVRQLFNWTRTLPSGCFRDHMERWLSTYESMIEDENNNRKMKGSRPSDDALNAGNEQSAARLLMNSLPNPPR